MKWKVAELAETDQLAEEKDSLLEEEEQRAADQPEGSRCWRRSRWHMLLLALCLMKIVVRAFPTALRYAMPIVLGL